jgi:type I restriction enzyme S subunit
MSSGSKKVVGKAAVLRKNWSGTFGAFCAVLRPTPEIDWRFFAEFFRTQKYRTAISELSAGVNINNIKRQYFQEIQIPLPPLLEQNRIATKINSLLERVNATRDRLTKIPIILKRFRHSVLATAYSGKLTKNWRLTRDLPDWDYTPLGEASVEIQTGPFGSMLHRHDYIQNGVPLINPMHIQDGEIYTNKEYCVSQEKAEELSRFRLKVGDVILGRRGEMGRAAIVKENQLGAICGTGSMFLRFNREDLLPEFLCFFLRSPNAVAALERNSVGSTMTNLNQRIVRSLLFPIVDHIEQTEVIRSVKALFKLADSIEQRITTANVFTESLTQSILAKAFHGELVSTEVELARREDRKYEPANVLLQRINELNNGKNK